MYNENCTWNLRPWKTALGVRILLNFYLFVCVFCILFLEICKHVVHWVSPLIIEPDQLFIWEITWAERKRSTNWTSLKMILRIFAFIRSLRSLRRLWGSFQYFYCLIEVWRWGQQLQTELALELRTLDSGRRFAKEINCRSAACFKALISARAAFGGTWSSVMRQKRELQHAQQFSFPS